MAVCIFQANISSTLTMGRVSGLNAFTNYSCTVRAVTVSAGPMSDPATVTTLEARMTTNHAKNITYVYVYVTVYSSYSSNHQHDHQCQ